MLPDPHPTRVRLILASASPSRGQLLRQAGFAFTQIPGDVDEESLAQTMPHATPADVALVLARAKAEAVVAAISTAAPLGTGEQPTAADSQPTVVLGCDSILELDGKQYGKPLTAAAATERWQQQRGRTASLVTGHWLVDVGRSRAVGRSIASEVTFVDATDDEIANYVASGEPLGVAGAFTLEGRAGPLIAEVRGDPSNVIGLSLPGLRTMLHELGLSLSDVTPDTRRGRESSGS